VPIASSDILFKFATTAGSAGNSGAGAANTSLGKYISTTQVTDATLNGLFDDVTGAENAALESEYRCVFVHNAHATLTLLSPVLWIASEVAGGAVCAIGLDPAGATAIGSAPVQAATIADENTAPAGVTFTAPTTKATGLALPSLAPGQCAAFWVKRTTTNSAAQNGDGVGWRVEGDTNA
jgi:hypothetical protein